MFSMYAFYYAKQIKCVDKSLYYYWQEKGFDDFSQICSQAVMSVKFYEENFALYSVTVSTVWQNRMYIALKELLGIRKNNEIFANIFFNYKRIKTPIRTIVFRIFFVMQILSCSCNLHKNNM